MSLVFLVATVAALASARPIVFADGDVDLMPQAQERHVRHQFALDGLFTPARPSKAGPKLKSALAHVGYQSEPIGACQIEYSDLDVVVALNHRAYGKTDSVSSKCGWRATIVNVANARRVEATVVDVCMGDECGGRDDLVLSLGAFDALLDHHDDPDNDSPLVVEWSWSSRVAMPLPNSIAAVEPYLGPALQTHALTDDTSEVNAEIHDSRLEPVQDAFDLHHPALSFALGTLSFQNETAGACGIAHRDSDLVVALPAEVFDSGEHCGREVAVRSEISGAAIRAVVGDRCWDCGSLGVARLDISSAVHDALAVHPDRDHLLPVAWYFV